MVCNTKGFVEGSDVNQLYDVVVVLAVVVVLLVVVVVVVVL